MRNLTLCALLLAACSPDDKANTVRFVFSAPTQTDCSAGQVCSCPSLQSWEVPPSIDLRTTEDGQTCRLLTEAGKFAELECNGPDGFVSSYRMVTLEKDGQWHAVDWTAARGFGCWYLADLRLD